MACLSRTDGVTKLVHGGPGRAFGRMNVSWQDSVVSALDFLEQDLQAMKAAGVFREVDSGQLRAAAEGHARRLGVSLIDASSNDYLNYAVRVSRETTLVRSPWGASASRLIHGTRSEHLELESALSGWVHQPNALLFTSGYAANIGTISALVRPEDLIISDVYNHASIVDGCRLSRARIEVVPHCQPEAVESALVSNAGKNRCWIVSESYYSMDGDSPNLAALRSICDTHQAALIVDEAHALGVFGPQGSGLCRQCGVTPDILIGTFGKAFAAQGAFIATCASARDWIWNRARSFVYSTAMSPQLAATIRSRLGVIRQDDPSRDRLKASAYLLRELLSRHDIAVLPGSHGPIVPIILGNAQRAQRVAANLCQRGILAQAIRPPTVPNNSCRIRLTLHAGITEEQIRYLADSLITACQ